MSSCAEKLRAAQPHAGSTTCTSNTLATGTPTAPPIAARTLGPSVLPGASRAARGTPASTSPKWTSWLAPGVAVGDALGDAPSEGVALGLGLAAGVWLCVGAGVIDGVRGVGVVVLPELQAALEHALLTGPAVASKNNTVWIKPAAE